MAVYHLYVELVKKCCRRRAVSGDVFCGKVYAEFKNRAGTCAIISLINEEYAGRDAW